MKSFSEQDKTVKTLAVKALNLKCFSITTECTKNIKSNFHRNVIYDMLPYTLFTVNTEATTCTVSSLFWLSRSFFTLL